MNSPIAPFEIFRAGRHTATNGQTIDFGSDQLAAIASGYDPALHEAPIVVGHPADNAPAYGWVKGVRIEGDRLSVDPDQVDTAFAELVQAGRYKKVSASFYRPDDPANPKPGNFYLRHVGFLGAQPPAVKGLRQVAFADASDPLTFADWNAMSVAGLFRGLRDWMIGQHGQDAADRVLPSYTIDGLTVDAARDNDNDNDNQLNPAYSERTDMTTQQELDKRAADLAQREADLNAKSAEFAERERKHRAIEFADFLDPLIKGGKVLPAHKNGLVAFMETIHDREPVSFGEPSDGNGGGSKKAPLDFLKGFLTGLPKAVEFREVGRSDEDLGARQLATTPQGYFVDPERDELRRKALAYQESHAGVDFVTAYKAVGGQ